MTRARAVDNPPQTMGSVSESRLGAVSRSARSLARRLFNQLGFDVHRVGRQARSSHVYDDPYQALLARPNRVVFSMPTSACLDKLGFSYGRWQPWVETAKQLVSSNEPLAYRDSLFRAFYETWSFDIIDSVFGSALPAGKIRDHFLKMFHGVYLPFSPPMRHTLVADIEASTKYLAIDNMRAGEELSMEESLRDDGTWSDRKGEIELFRLASLLQSITTHGYHRGDTNDGDIEGYLLRRDGELRFVVVRGLHRAAVLAALQHPMLVVRLFVNLIIDLESITSWPLVRQGVWSRAMAIRYFNHLYDFDGDGWKSRNGFGPVSPTAADRHTDPSRSTA